MSKKILNEIRQNLPVFTGGNDTYEHIFNIKLDIKAINEELEKVPKFKDIEKMIKIDSSVEEKSKKE